MSMREISSAGPLEGEALAFVFAGGIADAVVSSSLVVVVVVVVGSGVVVDGLGCSGATGSGCSGCASAAVEDGCSWSWSGDGLVVWSAGVGIMAWSGGVGVRDCRSRKLKSQMEVQAVGGAERAARPWFSVQVQARMRRRIVLWMGLARAADAARGQPSSGPA